MEYEQALELRNTLENDLKEANQKLKQFPKTEGGLTPDAIKFSKEYQEAKALRDVAFQALRNFNVDLVKLRKQHQGKK
jgi:hypothetical protein